MIKLLLVDDEAPTKMKLLSIVDWEKLGITEIVQADDGLDAMEKCADFEPDILLTDIRMPIMGGVQLAHNLLEKQPRTKVIFISGYSDKDYLKSAIRLGAIRYIEKPIQVDELLDALTSTVELIRNERQQNDQLREAKKREEILKSDEAALCLAQGRECGARVLGDSGYAMYVTVVVQIIENLSPGEKMAQYNKMAFLFYENHGYFNQPGFHFCFTSSADPMIIHILSESSDTSMKNYMAVSNFCSLLRKKVWMEHIPTVTGVGEFVSSESDLKHSYETAVLALNQAFFKEPGCICYYKQLSKLEYEFPQQNVEDFAKALSGENSSRAVLIVRCVASELRRYPDLPRQKILRYFYALTCRLMQHADEYSVHVFGEIGEPQDLWVYLNQFQLLSQLVDFLVASVEEYFSQLNGGQYDNRVVKEIIKYIRKNYADPNLSIISISDNVNLSPTYVCRVFKEATGTTINKCILQYRMQKAQEMIRENKTKVNEIARSVGYRNGNYFSFQFKKYSKYSPSEYREMVP